MKRKNLIPKVNWKAHLPKIVALLLGVMLGVGGTMGVQTIVLPALAKNTHGVKATPVRVEGPVVDIGEFTVNLQGGSFLKTTLTVEGTDAKAEAVLKTKVAFLKDRVNTVLSNKSIVDVQTPAAREKLRKELTASLNDVANHKIANVLFLSFTYQ